MQEKTEKRNQNTKNSKNLAFNTWFNIENVENEERKICNLHKNTYFSFFLWQKNKVNAIIINNKRCLIKQAPKK